MTRLFSFIALIALALATVFFLKSNHVVLLEGSAMPGTVEKIAATLTRVVDPNADLENQLPLANRPTVIKAIYSTAWSAGSEKKIQYFLDLLNTTELNAIVIDVKDYTGIVSYPTTIEAVNQYGASEKRIAKINALLKRLHDAGIYAVARISVFQDTKLAQARPDLALMSSSTGRAWTDRKKVGWVDTAAKEVWDYNVAIAKDALARGFDEVNFDYVRFASDGDLEDVRYPFYDETIPKAATLKKFFAYLREQLPVGRVSVDLFGLVTINNDDLGIGQRLEDAFSQIDYVAPMTYPSHYAAGFNGISNPAAAPYEIMKYSIDKAIARLAKSQEPIANSSSTASSSVPSSSLQVNSKLRPWIQDFDLGADYTPEMVRAQIQAIEDAARIQSGCISLTKIGDLAADAPSQAEIINVLDCAKYIDGWMLWSPSNVYTKEALLTE